MRALEPDVVKLDKALVQAPDDQDKAERLAEIRAFCRQSETVLLAEGIETAAHLANAQNLGAQLGQGWLFGRPSPRAHRVSTFRNDCRNMAEPA